MKKMKRFLVALLSCLTAVACVAGISACKDDNKKTDANNSSSEANSGVNITINDGSADCDHEYGVAFESSATCTEDGYKYIACLKCGKNTAADGALAKEPIAALNHKNATQVAKVDATCTTDGVIAHLSCPDCKAISVDGNAWFTNLDPTVKAKHNDNGEVAKVDAKCGVDGHTAYNYCTGCYDDVAKEEKYIIEYAKLMAKLGDETEAKKQLTALIIKEEADKLNITNKTVIPAYHTGTAVDFVTSYGSQFTAVSSLIDGKTFKASGACGVDGVKEFNVCNCYATKIGEVATKMNKAGTDAEKAANKYYNALEGKVMYNVSDVLAELKAADVEFETEAIPAAKAAHVLTQKDGLAATCTEAGTRWYKSCANCDWIVMEDGEHYNASNAITSNTTLMTIPATKHIAKANTVATCTTAVKCAICNKDMVTGDTNNQKNVDDEGKTIYYSAFAHKDPATQASAITTYATVAATCTSAGWTKSKCTLCNEVTTTISGSPLNHSWAAVSVDVQRTCTTGTLNANDAHHYYKCQKCDVYGINSGWKAAPTQDNPTTQGTITVGVVTWKDAPYAHAQMDAGKYICAPNYVARTCGADAQNYYCQWCQAAGKNVSVISETLVKATGLHVFTGKYQDTTDAKPANCFDSGICSVCGPVAAYNHLTVDGKSAWVDVKGTDATCLTDGTMAYSKCSRCQSVAIDVATGTPIYGYTSAGEAVTNPANFDTNSIAFSTNGIINFNALKIAKANHDYSVKVVATMVTCEVDGHSNYFTCKYCGEVKPGSKIERKASTVPHASADNSSYCLSICNKAHPSYSNYGTDANGDGFIAGDEITTWKDTNANGLWDAGEQVVTWAGCNKAVVVNNNALYHNWNTEDAVCDACGKQK